MSKSSDWLVCNEPKPMAKLKLYCFPYAGSGSMAFGAWAKDLPDWIELTAIQLPGREGRFREKPFTSMPELIDNLGKALVDSLEKPFAFFGHSMGGWVAFELARYLRRNYSLLPKTLFVSGCFAPHLPIPYNFSTLTDEQLVESMKSLQGIPEEILKKPSLIKFLLPILKADLSVCETYKYIEESPLECPLTVFGGDKDASVEYERLKAWVKHSSKDARIEVFPGDHFFLRNNQTQLLESITGDLKHIDIL